jgi:hypothetical protein
MTRSRALIGLVVAVAGMTACSSVPLQNPPTVQSVLTPELTRVAILRAASREEWSIDQDVPGKVRARVTGSGWFMSVDVSYGPEISMQYAESAGLGYQLKRQVPYIHGGYNSRCQDLLAAIQQEMQLMARYPEPPSSLEPLPPVGAAPPTEHFPDHLQKQLELKPDPAAARAPSPQ